MEYHGATDGEARMDPHRLNRLIDSLHASDSTAPVLRRLCRVGAAVTGGSGVGLSRIIDGAHELVEASDSGARQVELLQVTTAEGPCLDAIATQRPALEPDLDSDRARDRWPTFARAAVDQGISAAFAFPLMTGGVAIGALDIYSTVRGDLDDDVVANAVILADLAALAIDGQRGSTRVEGVDASTEAVEPWAYPAVVHNASGMVSEQLGISLDEALLRLRVSAFVMELPVAELAGGIVARTVRLDPWTDHG
jgi:transcriptional regulator with GAF, ATPase, and Fis domain